LGLFFMHKQNKSRKKFALTATCFDSKGRVIVTRANDYEKSSPWQKLYSVKSGMSDARIYVHAEVAALLASRDYKGESKVHSLLVQRFDSFGNPKLAKPCNSCMFALGLFRVKILRYTTDIGIKEEIL
jgi:hypothetical protein